jgi:hypothetical protein
MKQDKIFNIIRTPLPQSQPEQPDPLTRIEGLLTELLTETKKMANKKGRDSGGFESQWLSTAKAAEYCGDYSPETFRKLVKRYNIPKHGHTRKVFDRNELDEWMKAPRYFLNTNSPSRGRGRRNDAMAAIQNLFWAMVKDPLRDLYESMKQEREIGLW